MNCARTAFTGRRDPPFRRGATRSAGRRAAEARHQPPTSPAAGATRLHRSNRPSRLGRRARQHRSAARTECPRAPPGPEPAGARDGVGAFRAPPAASGPAPVTRASVRTRCRTIWRRLLRRRRSSTPGRWPLPRQHRPGRGAAARCGLGLRGRCFRDRRERLGRVASSVGRPRSTAPASPWKPRPHALAGKHTARCQCDGLA